MVIKNIILTFVAMFAVLSIPADRLVVTGPVTANEIGAEPQPVSPEAELAAVTSQIPSSNVAVPAILSMPVSGSAQYVAPVTGASSPIDSKGATISETGTAIISNSVFRPHIAADQRVTIGVPKVITLPERSRGLLVSEWLDVPSDVLDHVKTLPVPAIPKPEVRPFTPAETTLSAFTSSISKRQLSILFPKALTAIPAGRISKTQNATLRSSRAIFARQLLPLLAGPAVVRPTVRSFALTETTATNLSSGIRLRQFLPLLAGPNISRPTVHSFTLAETMATNVSSNISTRQLLPLLPYLSGSRSSAASFELSATNASNVSLQLAPQRLLPILPQPPIAKPLPRSFSLVETNALNPSSSIAMRPLQALLKGEIAKPSLTAFSPAETRSFVVSSAIIQRPLQAQIPEFLFKRSLTTETTSTQGSLAIGTRPTMPQLPDALIPTGVLSQTTSTAINSSPFSRELQKLVKAPIVVKQTLPASSVVAVTKAVSSTIDPQLTAVNFPTVRDLKPALISAQSVISPFGLIPTPSEMAVTEVAMPRASGPSIESSSTNEKSAASKSAGEPRPLLISAQNGFSADFLRPMSSKPVFPPNPNSGAPVVTAENIAPSVADGSYCDPNYVGQPIRFSQTVELKLEDLLNQLNTRFGVNFIIGPGIAQLPLNVKAGSIPWNVLLRSQLYLSGVRATCIDANTIELVLTDKVSELEKSRTQADKLETRFIKLKYLQPNSNTNKNIAGQSADADRAVPCTAESQGGQGGGGGGGSSQPLPQRCKFERLIVEIRQILGIGNSSATKSGESNGGSTVTLKAEEVGRRPYVGQVPGRNMLWVYGTGNQLREIDQLIRQADIPPWQIVIKGLVYTANEDKLKDIGVQTTITTGSGNPNGGISGHTLGTLGTLFDFSALIGTVDFNVQASALQRDGVISIKSRPFATVLDGNTTDLTVGRQVPVLIQAINPIGTNAPGDLRILQAANLLSVTPHVIDDDQGNPIGVKLELQLESNDVDTSVSSQGIPSISVRSIQSNFNLNLEQTAILGGFTVDSDSKTIHKTPGLGDIPIIGELFKRRVRASQINRLYFAVSVSVIPYRGAIEPVMVPGATTNPPSLTPELKKRSDAAEPKQVVK